MTTCDSCGRDEPEVWAVHRLYVTPETWETPGSTRRVDEVEHWCFACCSHYPHEPVDAADDAVDAVDDGPG